MDIAAVVVAGTDDLSGLSRHRRCHRHNAHLGGDDNCRALEAIPFLLPPLLVPVLRLLLSLSSWGAEFELLLVVLE